jgi:hypothetical protein
LILSALYHHISTLFQRKFQRISLQALQSPRACCRFAIQIFEVRGPGRFAIQVFQGETVRCPGLRRRVLRTASWRWQHGESADGSPFKFSRFAARPATVPRIGATAARAADRHWRWKRGKSADGSPFNFVFK